ncbi:Zn-dependent hydrolase [Bordetella genomosp. 9]|uniref:Zn-dependent hydrolase n=1 Tax=Bordetella genomosp. 9 TaxID=1416803 RepID=A0A261R114_9BORD|nr:MBL fold metallo-hydrolase [Bordetella genomosp. 9]OZI18671.1 Zn-dependent hydrolase [Bordetella genomosp. 9]
MLLRQFFDAASSTYTYLIATGTGGEALIIDPVKERLPDYASLLRQLDVRLLHAIDTHTHADHITALADLSDATGCATVMGEYTKADCVARRVVDGEILRVGDIALQGIYTPGHTEESFSFVLNPDRPMAVFTGDVLLIRGTGRTDFQGGDPRRSWDSIVNRLFRLPDDTIVYPAHDYRGCTASTIGEEKHHNPRLAGKTEAEYVAIMNGLNLPRPQLMDIAVPANLACGRV